MKVRHSILGFNEVSFEISNEYVRMYNFRPKELERNIIPFQAGQEKKYYSNLQPFFCPENRKFHSVFQRGFIGVKMFDFQLNVLNELKIFSLSRLDQKRNVI
jgi:hypothetical protein